MNSMNRIAYEWNNVYNFVMQIKDDYIKKFKVVDYDTVTITK